MRLSLHSQRDPQDILTPFLSPIERLEARRFLSAVHASQATLEAAVAGHEVGLVATSDAHTRAAPRRTLSLRATSGDDIVALDVKKTRVFFTLNGVTKKYVSTGVRTIAVALGNGDDVFVAGSGTAAM